MVFQDSIIKKTATRGFYDITADVANIASHAVVRTGVCNIFIQHTSASLIISENADDSVKIDLENKMQIFAKDGDPAYLHNDEGPDDMAAHIRSVLTQTSISVPVAQGQLSLGTWQAIYLWEHRFEEHQRRLIVTIIGEEMA